MRVEKTSQSINDNLANWTEMTQKKIEKAENTAREAKKAAEDTIKISQEAIARADTMVQSVRQAADEAIRASQEAADASKRAAHEAGELWVRVFGEMLSNTGEVNVNAKQVTQQTAEHLTAAATGKETTPAKTPRKPTEEEQAVTQKFEQAMSIEEPVVSDKQIAKVAKKKMQERMESLSRMYLKAETGQADETESDDDHVIEDS
jgi:hypothetical protein